MSPLKRRLTLLQPLPLRVLGWVRLVVGAAFCQDPITKDRELYISVMSPLKRRLTLLQPLPLRVLGWVRLLVEAAFCQDPITEDRGLYISVMSPRKRRLTLLQPRPLRVGKVRNKLRFSLTAALGNNMGDSPTPTVILRRRLDLLIHHFNPIYLCLLSIHIGFVLYRYYPLFCLIRSSPGQC
ncbi:hypothetical protein J6590_088525 [Homalodisca vitripennis]|nr:hypothetical protein J6590_088525 [Homalodisca vitripennis]